MSSHLKWPLWMALYCIAPQVAHTQEASQEWSESQLIERFLAQSTQGRELRARVAMTEAEARTRTVYQNPSVSWSREGAGYNQFFEASQTLPLSGRIRYLRDAGAVAVYASDASREAVLWSLRSDLRIAFYRMVAAQKRVRTVTDAISEVDKLVRLLRKREEEGEGSRYDRLRAEHEAFELRTDLTTARSIAVAAGAQLSAYLPEGSEVRLVRGELSVQTDVPELEALIRRAMNSRSDYRAAQRVLSRFQIEEQAARRLRIPEPVVTVGVKRANVIAGVPPSPFADVTRSGLAVSLSVPLPVFNSGRLEVARQQAEQEQASARMAVLERQIHSEIQGARDVLAIRTDALGAYQKELASAGTELSNITQVAWQEGEIGILEVLDSLRVSRAARLRTIDLEAAVREAWIDMERAVGEELSGREGRP